MAFNTQHSLQRGSAPKVHMMRWDRQAPAFVRQLSLNIRYSHPVRPPSFKVL